jgi:hypothetical protein
MFVFFSSYFYLPLIFFCFGCIIIHKNLWSLLKFESWKTKRKLFLFSILLNFLNVTINLSSMYLLSIIYLPTSIYLSIYLYLSSTYLPTYLPTYLSVCLSIYL